MRLMSFCSPTVFNFRTLTVLGCLSIMIFNTVGDSSQVTDTCGHYFFLPMFPACELFLEVIPCYNDTPNVIVTMSTPGGDVVQNLVMVFGVMTEIPLQSINKAKHEGLIIRSNEDISVYLHNTSGDSMIIYPIDALARDYEIPRLTSHKDFRDKRTRNSGKNYHDGALYIFSPFNNTSITIIQLYDAKDSSSQFLSSHPSSASISSSTFSSTTVKLDAFEIYEYHIDTFRRYRLFSTDVFAIILVQTSNKFSDNGSLCVDAKLSLLDFVPPFSVKGKYFYLAFPKVTEFGLFVTGLANTSLDLTTDTVSRELFLDHSGNFITVVSRTSSAWITASQPVSIYIKMTLCSNASSANVCAENGFFLPSVEHYFTCDGNMTKGGCICTCPSFFQRELNPSNFHILRNSSKARPTTIYPLLVGDLFDVTTSIVDSKEFKDADDIIVTTNTSFLSFRFDLDNLNFLPSGTTLGNVYRICVPNIYNVPFHSCDDKQPPEDNKKRHQLALDVPDNNQCSCEFFQDSVMFPSVSGDSDIKYSHGSSGGGKSRPAGGDGGDDLFWVEEDDDTARPLIAVVVSLCVSIFAVIALISGYMLVEMTTKRKHVRNTKIRPFVS